MATTATSSPLCDRRRCPSGDSSCKRCARSRLLCGLAPSLKGAPPWASHLRVLPMPASAVPTGASHARKRPRSLAVPLATGYCACWRPTLVGAWPWVAAPAGGLAVAGPPR
ncbi:hypothetical protein BHE74_00047011 [Ensete ventricosum]|nr:hypothetical protein BHE74_00047011 [Ensete ventricosum]